MGRATKLYQRLDALEASLTEQLIRELTSCANGRNDLIFCAKEFLPKHYPRSLPTRIADGLLDQVERIRALREKVGEPFTNSLAFRFRECCRQWADHCDHHRGCARTIAEQLLADIANSETKGRS